MVLLRNTRPFNALGLPTISVPCGFTKDGLPIGLQITGAAGDEVRVLALAHAYEQATDWHTRRPDCRAQAHGLRPSGRISSFSLSSDWSTGHARVPARDRLLARLVERLHRLPDLVDLVGEEVADQEVGDLAAQLREALDELAEAEAVVVLAHQAAHAVDALVEGRAPLAELGRRGVALREPLADRVGGQLARRSASSTPEE